MDCPICKVNLQLSDRQGVEIDYCPKCRGIWLDRGELEKLIELATAKSAVASPPSATRDRGFADDEDYDDDDDRHSRSKTPKKKESWLSELFDFG